MRSVRGEPEERRSVRGREEFRDPPVKVDRLSDDDAHLCNVLSCPQVPRVSLRQNLFDLFSLKSIISSTYTHSTAMRTIYDVYEQSSTDDRKHVAISRTCDIPFFLPSASFPLHTLLFSSLSLWRCLKWRKLRGFDWAHFSERFRPFDFSRAASPPVIWISR